VVIAERERRRKKREQTYARKEKEKKMKQTPHGFVRHLLMLYTVQQTYVMIEFSSSSFDTQAR
jgi:hypothetical protein